MKSILEYLINNHINKNIDTTLFTSKTPKKKEMFAYLDIFFDANGNIDDMPSDMYIMYKDLKNIPLDNLITYVNDKADELEKKYNTDVVNISFCYYSERLEKYTYAYYINRAINKTKIISDGGDNSREYNLIAEYFDKYVEEK